MKRLSLLFLSALVSIGAVAQEEMPTVWETDLGHKISFTGTGLEGEYSYAADDKDITVFDNNSGKVIWTKAFKDMAPKLRKIDELIPFWGSKTIFLFDRKLGADQIAVIDLKTGELLWNTDKYQEIGEDNLFYIREREGFIISLKDGITFIKSRTGEEVWSTAKFKGSVGQAVYSDDGNLTMVNFKPGGLASQIC